MTHTDQGQECPGRNYSLILSKREVECVGLFSPREHAWAPLFPRSRPSTTYLQAGSPGRQRVGERVQSNFSASFCPSLQKAE